MLALQLKREGQCEVKVVSAKKCDEVLGLHLIGPHATELLAEACVALQLEPLRKSSLVIAVRRGAAEE